MGGLCSTLKRESGLHVDHCWWRICGSHSGDAEGDERDEFSLKQLTERTRIVYVGKTSPCCTFVNVELYKISSPSAIGG